MGRADDLDALLFVCRRPIIGADVHAPDTEFRDFQRTQLARVCDPRSAHFCAIWRGCPGQRSNTQTGPNDRPANQNVTATEAWMILECVF
ncbi:hypothetical protein D3C85_1539570 [compost metagenome]